MTDLPHLHITLGQMRAWIAAHADKPADTRVSMLMEHGIDEDTTYASVTSVGGFNFYEADGDEPACLALSLWDNGPVDPNAFVGDNGADYPLA